VERAPDRIPRLPRESLCPLRELQAHSAKGPGTLKKPALQHIERQIIMRDCEPLPILGEAMRLYRCPDCHAVWPAGSRYERVSKDTVRGFYDHSLIWQPYRK
jgi:hypothetical protein